MRSEDGVEFEVNFREGDSPADVEITLSGVPDLDGLTRLNERLVSDSRFRAGLKMLVDLRALDTAGLSGEAVQILSESMAERDWLYPPAAVALVAPDEGTYDAVRLYRAHLGGSRSNRHLLSGRADAVAWLTEQRRAAQ